MEYFACKEETGGEWDLKNGPYPSESTYLYYGQIISGEDVGNIHYGYVGYSMLPNSGLLHLFAGLYQLYSNTSRREWAFWYFDDPRDYDMIDWGIRLFQIDFGG